MQMLRVKTNRRTEFVDVTKEIQSAITESATKNGVCHLYVPHTTAAITINEHADPDVARDVEGIFDHFIPERGPYKHAEGNSDSHVKAILVGAKQTIFITNGKLVLGHWQSIFFCEFDGPRNRKLYVKTISHAE